MAGQHSRLGPSGFKAAKLCPGKLNAEDGLPDEVTVYAAEGTAFHEVAADCLEHGLEPEDFLGREIEADGFEFVFDEAMARHMRKGLDRVRELAANAHLLVETQVSLAGIFGDDDFGTTDATIIRIEEREMTVFDWKYGMGVAVDPIDNDQAKLYALGTWNTIAWKAFGDPSGVKVRVIIEQPRNGEGGGEWWTTMDDLLQWAQDVARPVYEATLRPDAPRVPGEVQCQFCKARFTCAERAAWHLETMSLKFEDLDGDPGEVPDLPRESALTPERRAYIVRHKGLIEKWLEDLHTGLIADALQGRPTGGLKAVRGQTGKRFWTDKKSAEKLLIGALGTEKAYKRTLLSPAQAEDLLGTPAWEKALAFIDKGEGKPILVSADDKRPAIQPVADSFDDLTTEDLI